MRNEINNEIEYLRALSVILVVISHYGYFFPYIYELLPSVLKISGFGYGVDLFFCISGYVVSKAYIDYFDQNKINGNFWPAAISFWMRRCYRLLPSAWFWMIVGIFLSIFFNQSEIFNTPTQNIKSAISIILFSANIATVHGMLEPNLVYWSLSLEEQFYFIFPFFLFLIPNNKIRVFSLITIIVIQSILSRSIWGNITEQYTAIIRTDSFAWGILIYTFSKTELYKKININKLPFSKLMIIIVYFLLTALLLIVPIRMGNYGLGLVAITSAAFVWIASYNTLNIKSNLIKKQLLWLGRHSYAIYLIHFLIIRISIELLFIIKNKTNIPVDQLRYPMIILSLIIIFYLASLNYKYIENPLRKKGKIIAIRFLLSKKMNNIK